MGIWVIPGCWLILFSVWFFHGSAAQMKSQISPYSHYILNGFLRVSYEILSFSVLVTKEWNRSKLEKILHLISAVFVSCNLPECFCSKANLWWKNSQLNRTLHFFVLINTVRVSILFECRFCMSRWYPVYNYYSWYFMSFFCFPFWQRLMSKTHSLFKK